MTLIKTRKEICDYIGEDSNDFLTLIKDRGMPAWRSKPNGVWKARRATLDAWLEKQEEVFLRHDDGGSYV